MLIPNNYYWTTNVVSTRRSCFIPLLYMEINSHVSLLLFNIFFLLRKNKLQKTIQYFLFLYILDSDTRVSSHISNKKIYLGFTGFNI